jgi:hypothetical protein
MGFHAAFSFHVSLSSDLNSSMCFFDFHENDTFLEEYWLIIWKNTPQFDFA